MVQRVCEALDEVTAEHGVRLLFAVESGSRAWGFASPDSDWDVRFVYAHPLDWYLKVMPGRDVIEAMLPGDLDLSGWELRKALFLFAKGNFAFNEWLDSPIVYHAEPGILEALRALVASVFRPTSAMFHYLGIARSAFPALRSEQVKLKKVFYVLRPLLACRWIVHTLAQPPTAFAALVEAPWVDAAEREMITLLEAAKAHCAEGETRPLQPQVRRWIVAEMEEAERIAPSLACKAQVDMAALDLHLKQWILRA